MPEARKRIPRPRLDNIWVSLHWPRFADLTILRLIGIDLANWGPGTSREAGERYFEFESLDLLELTLCENERNFLEWIPKHYVLSLGAFIYTMAPKRKKKPSPEWYAGDFATLRKFLRSFSGLRTLGITLPEHLHQDTVKDIIVDIRNGNWFQDQKDTLTRFYLGLAGCDEDSWDTTSRFVERNCPNVDAWAIEAEETRDTLYEDELVPGANQEWPDNCTMGTHYMPEDWAKTFEARSRG